MIPYHSEKKNSFHRDVSLLLGIPFVLIVLLMLWWQPWTSYRVPPSTDIFTVVAGTWDWEGAKGFCTRDSHTITFSPDHRVMVLHYTKPWTDSAGVEHTVGEYDIQEADASHIRGMIRGETRRTAAGEPVVWDLQLQSHDVYRWHRTDWPNAPGLGVTRAVRRCPRAPR